MASIPTFTGGTSGTPSRPERFPEWDFGVQVFPDNEDQTFEGIDLLDPTKLVPEELAPVQIIGRLTLNRNPTNYFAETEQVAFCTAHVPRGIDFTDDPLLQARNFSYLDTQLTRLGGPNFDQLPINRPRSAVNTTQRDGFGQQAVAEGIAPTTRIRSAAAVHFPPAGTAFVSRTRVEVSGQRVRARAASFSDHYSQATLFWKSMSPPEREHIVGAFSFELGKCLSEEVKERVLANLANVDAELTKARRHQSGQGVLRRESRRRARGLSRSEPRPYEPGTHRRSDGRHTGRRRRRRRRSSLARQGPGSQPGRSLGGDRSARGQSRDERRDRRRPSAP